MKNYLLIALLLISVPIFAQEPAISLIPPAVDTSVSVAQLKEQKANLIKQGAQKDAEIAKLRQTLATTPENTVKRIQTLTTGFKGVRQTEVYKACRAAKGKTLITQDKQTGQLTFAGCLL